MDSLNIIYYIPTAGLGADDSNLILFVKFGRIFDCTLE